MIRMFVAIGREKEFLVADIAAPAAELGGFVMAEGNPESGRWPVAANVDLSMVGAADSGAQTQSASQARRLSIVGNLNRKETKTQGGRVRKNKTRFPKRSGWTRA
jgi:hypothetical protein